MRLTKKKALDLTIELWEWLEETGGRKKEWPELLKHWSESDGRFCPLCDYTNQTKRQGCRICILYQNTGHLCMATPFGDWQNATTKLDRKKYAGMFLKQLKEIRDGRTKV